MVVNRLPLDPQLAKRGLVTVGCCSTCSTPSNSESLLHNFIQCDFAVAVWQKIEGLLQMKVTDVQSIPRLIKKVVARNFSPQVSEIKMAAAFYTLWNIWIVRNGIRFQDKSVSVADCVKNIMKDVKSVSFMMKGSMTNPVSDLTVIKNFQCSPKLKRNPKIIQVYWIPPPPTWNKCNIDGASRGNPGKAGCGGIFRNSRAMVKGCFSMPLGVESAFVAELSAFIQAIHLAKIKGWFPLWIETDSQVLMSKVRNRTENGIPWHIKSKWRWCLRQITEKNFSITHIYREGNMVADGLANLSFSLCDLTWWNQYPGEVEIFVGRDASGMLAYRFM